MSVTVYIPREATALSLGADAVSHAIAAQAEQPGQAVNIVRNGSRGLFWLDPLIEVQTAQGRIAYGPVQAGDVPGLFAAGLLSGGAHPLRHGRIESIPYLSTQQRLTCARIGVIDPLDIDDYCAHSGYAGLRAALAMAPSEIVQALIDSGLRGRGGAAFPTGIKWRTVHDAAGAQKYIVCNADEGDSGTYSDRLLMECDPYCLIEGMTIAAIAVGATRGYIYLRCEYPHAHSVLKHALASAYRRGYLGADVMNSRRRFDLEVRLGAGAYICGEETSLLESLEGRRGQIRFKPPLPAIAGLFGCPTVVNNVISFASVPIILERGAQFYRDYGIGRSRGTLPVQLAGNVARGGLVEIAFGKTLRELLYDYGGGTRTGRPIRAVQVGGPLGAYWPAAKFDTPVDYEAFAQAGGMLGHGGIVVFDDSVNLATQARYAMEFCAIESCGKCTPCRIGSTRGVEVIDRLVAGDRAPMQQVLLRDLCDTMLNGSLCALGGLTPFPVLSALDHFPEDFSKPAAPRAAGS